MNLTRVLHAVVSLAIIPSTFAAAQTHLMMESAAIAAAPAMVQPVAERWLDVKALTYGARYRATKNWHGRDLFDFGQERMMAEGRLKFDRDARYTLNFRMSSGRYFNWSYADLVGGQYKDSVVAARAYKTKEESAALKVAVKLDPNGAVYSAGIPSRGGYFLPRQMFLSATPVDAVTVEFGSLYLEHGLNTEITSFDDDGYLSGERVRIHAPKRLFFDQIAVTNGYVGSPLTPNFFARGTDLGKSNYQQYLAMKKLGKYVSASTDFTAMNSTRTMREAVVLKTPGALLVDSARVELYQRPGAVKIEGQNFAGGSGYSVALSKLMAKRLDFTAGYADVDERYAVYGGSIYLATVGFAWNGDAYETGKRAFGRAELTVAPGVAAFGFYTHTVVDPTIGHNLQGLNAGIAIDAKTLMNKGRRVF